MRGYYGWFRKAINYSKKFCIFALTFHNKGPTGIDRMETVM